jgi:putative transposase
MITIKERELIIKWNVEGKNQQEIADLVNCHQSSVSRFLRKYHQKGIIKNLPRSGRPTKLTKVKLSQLKYKIHAKIKDANHEFCSLSTKQVKKLIHNEIGEEYTMRHIGRIMHKLGFSLITPRPQHIRHDQEKVDAFRQEFKKKFNRSMWVMK